jgi:GT2 family glycosyltransferase
MDTSGIDLSIVIVTWNAREYALECLKSLQQQDGALSTEIIVVDNASADGTPDAVKREFPHVRLVENESNLGFAKANNIGIRLSNGKYICLINSDVNVPRECLPRMHAYMELNREVGVLAPRMRGRNGQIGRSYMRFPTVWNCLCRSLALDSLFKGSKAFGGTMMTDFKNDQTAEVDVLNGWFLMVRREALDKVGLLDERFFMYGEDIEWSYRFHRAGWKRVYFAGAEALHYGGASSANAPTRFYVEMKKADIQFWRKHHGRIGTLAYLLTVWVHEVVRILGHGALFLLKKSLRAEAKFKVKRSWACVAWLFGAKPSEKVLP